MDDCCKIPLESSPEMAKAVTCPDCGALGRAVEVITLKSLLNPEALKRLQPVETYLFCSTQDCKVVYFSRTALFRKDEVRVPVFQKDMGGSVPVCYCFGYTREEISTQARTNPKTSIFDEITRHVEEGRCACELRNPQGSCCLGNITKIIRETLKSAEMTQVPRREIS